MKGTYTNTIKGQKKRFNYDRLGRLVVSRNAKQQAAGNYSYTVYDDLGRIKEVGQKPHTTTMSQTISRDEFGPNGLRAWLNNTTAGGIKEQITRTVYDIPSPLFDPTSNNNILWQRNLRNRVSYTYVKNTDNNNAGYSWNSATLYSYDIHGNVDTLLQDYGNSTGSPNAMNTTGNRFKKIVYDYDLVSGKVNEVSYQPGQADAFYHKYLYDAENRLTDVETSNDKIVWERDARYNYYKHGPLARTVLGNNQVQGIDYAYTLQGQLKGINSTSVGDGSFDMGGDGKAGSSNSNIARDVYGISLNYFTGDYKPVALNTAGFANPFATIGVANDLFNGNIKSMVVNIPKLGDPLTYGFKYDQLNRLVAMDAYNGLNNTSNTFTAITINDYKERLSYDPNGNIKTYLRNGTGTTINLNNYSYTYTAGTNKLASITNSVNAQTKNYAYDEIGNTTTDGMQNMTNAVWNPYGKLQSATNNDGASIAYTYDAGGQRISKKVGAAEEWYVRDAAGNNIVTYKKDAAINNNDLTAAAFYKYGSRLLSIKDAKINVEHIVVSNGTTVFERGNDNYILTDANGNTRAIITDKKIQAPDPANPAQVLYYLADVKTANYYSSYGATAKTFGQTPVLAFNGQRKSAEIGADAQTALFWEYNGDVGRRNNLDPKPNISVSPYNCFNGNPFFYSDPYGDTTKIFNAKNGRYMRTIYDNLPNQSHFVSGAYLPANWKKNTTQDQIAEYVRSKSVAFLGANSAADAQAIEKSANASKHEVFFLGKISSTREIRLTAITLPKEAYKGSAEISVGDFFSKAVSDKESAASFLVGHTHQLSITKGSDTDPTKPTPPGKSWWSYQDNGSGDYGPLLKRLVTKHDGTVAGQETYQTYEVTQTPALILTHTSLTIYGTGTEYKTPLAGDYGSVPNTVPPVQQSNVPYKSLKQ